LLYNAGIVRAEANGTIDLWRRASNASTTLLAIQRQ